MHEWSFFSSLDFAEEKSFFEFGQKYFESTLECDCLIQNSLVQEEKRNHFFVVVSHSAVSWNDAFEMVYLDLHVQPLNNKQ